MRFISIFVLLLAIACAGVISWKYFFPLQQSHSTTTKESIIEHALNLHMPATDKAISAEALEFKKQAFKKIEQSDYEKALEIILLGLQKIPKSFTLQTYLATLIGDLSEKFTSPLKERMIEKSKMLFNKLMSEVEDQPKREVYRFKNEYYYRFGMYQQQYELGLKMVADYWGTKEWVSQDGLSGYYYQGAGAAYHAKKLLLEGKKLLALAEAQKSLVSWTQYFTYENDYYNSYVHYALVLGILGYRQEMLRALQHGADLIKRDLNYHEFKEVITFIDELEKE